jgi:predicted SnoaL-like aldol condensation-catalyzing enzyme
LSIKENKALARHVYELLNNREFNKLFELWAPGYILHSISGDLSAEQARQFEVQFFVDFPDAKANVEETIAEGEKVAVLVTWQGTHKATGKKIKMTNANIFRITDGKLAELWNVTDIRLAQQLGDVPNKQL